MERTKQIIKLFNFKNAAKQTRLNLKNDVFLLGCVFEKPIKVSIIEFGINTLYWVSLPGYTWQGALKNTGTNLQTL